jgi:hypothetical protein
VKKYTFFGYSGNYPENQINALRVRGCWKFLDYKEAVDTASGRSRGRRFDEDFDKPSNQMIDEAIIDKCSFVWRPVNYYDSVQKRIDKKNGSLVYNHFELLKCIGTKSGLIRSLK